MSAIDTAIAALAAQMSASLLAMSQDGATEALTDHAEALSELVQDLSLAVEDPVTAPTFTGWAPAGLSTRAPDFPPAGLLKPP